MSLLRSIYWGTPLHTIHFNLPLLVYRLFGKCREGCWRRPQWKYAPYSPGEPVMLACDLHVSRGCCSPYGTTVCCEWDRLPFFTGDVGEEDPVAVAEEEARFAEESARIDACSHNWSDWEPAAGGMEQRCLNQCGFARWMSHETYADPEARRRFMEEQWASNSAKRPE